MWPTRALRAWCGPPLTCCWRRPRILTPLAARSAAPTPRSQSPPIHSPGCGGRLPCCVSTAATDTWPPWSLRASMAARRSCCGRRLMRRALRRWMRRRQVREAIRLVRGARVRMAGSDRWPGSDRWRESDRWRAGPCSRAAAVRPRLERRGLEPGGRPASRPGLAGFWRRGDGCGPGSTPGRRGGHRPGGGPAMAPAGPRENRRTGRVTHPDRGGLRGGSALPEPGRAAAPSYSSISRCVEEAASHFPSAATAATS